MVMTLVAITSQVQAFDGDRNGFMLNLGAGFGKAEFSISNDNSSVSLDENGFGGDFKIGMGNNSQTLIYYTNRTLFYTIENVDFINGMSAIGASYFFEPQAPSFFLSAGMGLGVLAISTSDSFDTESESGLGFTVGAGYEFATNWIIEATYLDATVASENNIDLGISNLMISVSWFAY